MKSLACWVCFLVGPCTWEPGQGVPGCRGGLRPSFLCSCSCLVFKRLPQEWSYLSFHPFTCTMGFAPIKWTCTAFFRPRQLTDRAILAIRQTQEKKGSSVLRHSTSFLTDLSSFFPRHCVKAQRHCLVVSLALVDCLTVLRNSGFVLLGLILGIAYCFPRS